MLTIRSASVQRRMTSSSLPPFLILILFFLLSSSAVVVLTSSVGSVQSTEDVHSTVETLSPPSPPPPPASGSSGEEAVGRRCQSGRSSASAEEDEGRLLRKPRRSAAVVPSTAATKATSFDGASAARGSDRFDRKRGIRPNGSDMVAAAPSRSRTGKSGESKAASSRRSRPDERKASREHGMIEFSSHRDAEEEEKNSSSTRGSASSGNQTIGIKARESSSTRKRCAGTKKRGGGGTTKHPDARGRHRQEVKSAKEEDGQPLNGKTVEKPSGESKEKSPGERIGRRGSRMRRDARELEEILSEGTAAADGGEEEEAYPEMPMGDDGEEEYDENNYEFPQIGESRSADGVGGGGPQQLFNKRPKYYPDWGPKRTWRINMMRVWGKRGLIDDDGLGDYRH